MSKELALIQHSYFVATNGEEMAKAQSGLVIWVSAKLESVKKELRDVSKAVEHAREHKWAIGALQRQKNLWYGRRIYYEKMLEALRAGYVLVPEFPIDLFAIRTARTVPMRQAVVRSGNWGGDKEHPADRLPVGEGEYKNPNQERFVEEINGVERGTGKAITKYEFTNSTEFSDVDFPMIACRPEVMSAASAAMARKIFDTVGVAPQTRKGDPLIIGVIEGPKVGYTQKKCHFLISWHINVADL